ncbi:MAG: hypothetical protein [Caudoviricetes sp.]|nr:MAG: hypothetical protein [Caudoviricetes sp.]
MLFGIIHNAEGRQLNDGYSLSQVEELATDLEFNEYDVYELTGDLAVAPKLLADLVNRIKELELRVSKNPETKVEA